MDFKHHDMKWTSQDMNADVMFAEECIQAGMLNTCAIQAFF